MAKSARKIKVRTLNQLLEAGDPRLETTKWGPWRFVEKNRLLVLDRPTHYDIPLDECRTSAEVLDWIAQIAGKPWATNATVGALVRAFDDVLRLQATLCGGGVGKQIDAKEVVIERTIAARKQKERRDAKRKPRKH